MAWLLQVELQAHRRPAPAAEHCGEASVAAMLQPLRHLLLRSRRFSPHSFRMATTIMTAAGARAAAVQPLITCTCQFALRSQRCAARSCSRLRLLLQVEAQAPELAQVQVRCLRRRWASASAAASSGHLAVQTGAVHVAAAVVELGQSAPCQLTTMATLTSTLTRRTTATAATVSATRTTRARARQGIIIMTMTKSTAMRLMRRCGA